MDRLKTFSLSACRLKVNSSNKHTELSGVWVKGLTRDSILTVSHFAKSSSATSANTTAKVFSTFVGNEPRCEAVDCKLVYDFSNATNKKDFAIFAPKEDIRRPVFQSIPIPLILPEVSTLSGLAISFGYNTAPTSKIESHINLPVQDCPCTNCWYASGLRPDLGPLEPNALVPGHRTISVGEWKQSQSLDVYHTVTGWYGISGAGMYAKDKAENIHLVALCKFWNLLHRFCNCLTSNYSPTWDLPRPAV